MEHIDNLKNIPPFMEPIPMLCCNNCKWIACGDEYEIQAGDRHYFQYNLWVCTHNDNLPADGIAPRLANDLCFQCTCNKWEEE